MGAAGIDYEQALGVAHHPDAEVLLEAGVHSNAEVGGVADGKPGAGFKKSAGKEKAHSG